MTSNSSISPSSEASVLQARDITLRFGGVTALAEVAIGFRDLRHDRRFRSRIHQVQDACRHLDAANAGRLQVGAAGELALHDLVEFLECRRLDAVELGDAHQHVGAHPIRQLQHHFSGLIRIKVGQHDGDDLRVLVAHQIGNRTGLHPLQRFEALGIAAEQDAVDQARGLVFAECAHQYATHVIVGTDAEAGLGVEFGDKAFQHFGGALARDIGQGRHRLADLLHILGTHVLEHFGGFRLTEGHQQDGSALRPRNLVLRHGTHPSLPTQFLTSWATRFGSWATACLAMTSFCS